MKVFKIGKGKKRRGLRELAASGRVLEMYRYTHCCLHICTRLKDELDAKVIETNDASRRNVELELDVKRLSADLNSTMSK